MSKRTDEPFVDALARASQPANTRARSFDVPVPPADIPIDELVLVWVSRKCGDGGCGEPQDSWMHRILSSECEDCKAPQEHHAFVPETPEQAQRRTL